MSRRRKRSRESYVSRDPEKRAAQLANLRGAPPAPAGNARRLKHGAASALLVRDVEAEVRELMDALADVAPVREPDGSFPAADTVAVESAARALKRARHVTAWLDTHGRLHDNGHVKPAAELEPRLWRDVRESCGALGLDPSSRTKLGLDLARAQHFDLAAHWAQEDDDAIEGTASDAG